MSQLRKSSKHKRGTSHPQGGYALMTVLGVLAVFAVLGIAFTMRMRLEEMTSVSRKTMAKADAVANSGIQLAQGVLLDDKLGPDGIPFSGDEGYIFEEILSELGLTPNPPRNLLEFPAADGSIQITRRGGAYDSKLSQWYWGISGFLNGDSVDLRRIQMDPERNRWFWLGVDEDPPGDRSGDDAPGIAGRDDDLNGIVDEDRDGQPLLLKGGGRNRLFDEDYILDDDEDGRIDEDPRDFSPIGGGLYPEGLGIDNDGDAVGIEDESSKININLAGNISLDPQFSYNQGLGPWELDLGLALAGRLLPVAGLASTGAIQIIQQLAREVVLYRYGDDGKPGLAGIDDQNTNASFFVHIAKSRREESGRDYGLFSAVVGNGLEDTFKSPSMDPCDNWTASTRQQSDHEGEIYIGYPQQPNPDYWSVTRPWENNTTIRREIFLPGDGLDNDGDGQIDEVGEEVDDPTEFGLGDDRPWRNLDEFRRFILTDPAGISSLLLPGKTLEDVYEALKPIITVNSKSPIYGPGFFSEGNPFERRLIAPNLLNQYTPIALNLESLQDQRPDSIAVTLENHDSPNQPELKPLAFPNDVRYLYPLSIDDDRDWRIFDERGGRIVFFDLNRNSRPDGDWDGGFESRCPPEFWNRPWPLPQGKDMSASELLLYEEYERTLFERYSFLNPALHDRDGDGWMGDHGDFNADGEVRYDPEWGVNEDPPGRADGTKDAQPGRVGDDDGDGRADFSDLQVNRAVDNPETDEIDNDADGMIDEVGETYIAAFDDDEDGRYDEDGPELQFWANLMDSIDEPPLCNIPLEDQYAGLESYFSSHPYYRPFIYDASVAGGEMAKGMNPTEINEFPLWTARMVYDATFFDPRDPGRSFTEDQPYGETYENPGALINIRGVEAVRINEVAAYPIIRIQLEENQNADTSYTEKQDWERKSDGLNNFYAKQQEVTDQEHEWTFTHIPPGEYRVVLYRAPVSAFPAVLGATECFWPSEIFINEATNSMWVSHFNTLDEESRFMREDKTVVVTDDCTLRIKVSLEGETDDYKRWASLDYIELIRWRSNADEPNLDLQYIELINIAENPYPIDLSGWEILTGTVVTGPGDVQHRERFLIPHGTLILPDDPMTEEAENYLVLCRDAKSLLMVYDGLTEEEAQNAIDDGDHEDIYRYYELLSDSQNPVAFNIVSNATEVNKNGTTWLRLAVQGQVDAFATDMIVQLKSPNGVMDEMRIPNPYDALYGGEGEPSDEFARATLPFQVFERGDPTAMEYDLYTDDPGIPREPVLDNWARFYAKEALMIDRRFQTSWKWNTRMVPDDPDFLCYTHDGNDNAANRGVILVWKDVPWWDVRSIDSRDRFLRVRVVGEEGEWFGEVRLESAGPALTGDKQWVPMRSGEVSAASRFVRIEPWRGWTGAAFDADPDDYEDMRGYYLYDDNYKSFLHIELRNVKDADFNAIKYVEFTGVSEEMTSSAESLWYLSGSPGLPNPLYEPLHNDPAQQHKKALVKNSRLANLYDLSRIATGGEFQVLGIEKAAQLADLVRFQTTPTEQVEGLININTATRPVLMALPWMEPVWTQRDNYYYRNPNGLLRERFEVADRIARAILEYRDYMLDGFDGQPGVADVDDDLDGVVDNLEERNWPGSDDPPFDTIGDLAILFTNPKSSVYLGFGAEWRSQNSIKSISGMENATPASVFGRVSNLMTVRSDVFSVRTRGKVLGSEGGVLAEKLIEAAIER